MKKEQYKIELSDEAENDFDKSYEYYAKESEKVADNFYKQVDNSFNKISKNPHAYPQAYKKVRKLVIKRFPFIIYYQIKQVVVRIVAIFHASRNPEIWKDRAKNEDN